jgi:ceramide glucosyltransferase
LLSAARWLVLIAAVAPLAYYAVAIACAHAFFGRRQRAIPDFCPRVSILKPVRGLNRETYQNLASFCRQDYPGYELIFCVDELDDPAVPIIRGLMAEYAQLPIQLLVGDLPAGSNRKVAKLCRMAREAAHDLLVVSDSDIRVEPDYLRSVTTPFRRQDVGAVTCLYRGIAAACLWSELEDVAATSSFMPGVLVAWRLGLRFALGATMAVRRNALAGIGGFESLADIAADDHELGKRISASGYRVEIASSVVETECGSRTFVEYFRQQLRRAVVTRESQAAGHFGFLLAQGLPWAIAAAILSPSQTASVAFVCAYLVLRLGMAFVVGRRGLRDRLISRKWWLVPLDDALGFAVWLTSLFANRVVWQGSVYNVRQGRLRLEKPPA